MKRTKVMTSAAVASFLFMSLSAQGGGHSWVFNEIFSNPDGTIMFIELKEPSGFLCQEKNLAPSNYVKNDVPLNQYNFPTDLFCPVATCCTANKFVLLATSGFAALPGAPTPDYIIPDGFLNLAGSTLHYSFYAQMIYGAVPIDGVSSLSSLGAVTVNSPTNFNGDTANVIARCKVADFNQSGSVNVTDLLQLLASWGPCPPPCAADTDFSGTINVTDLLTLLADWGDCPP